MERELYNFFKYGEICCLNPSCSMHLKSDLALESINLYIVANPHLFRWEEMNTSKEKDLLDFQPLTMFMKCYAVYFS